jgi:uncharacterized membrane protein YkvA (DUF1232 family)
MAGFDPRQALDPGRALVPAVVRVNEEKVNRGLLPKLKRLAARLPFAGDILAVWYCARDEETPVAAKGMMFAALAYFVLPADAVPDFIAGLGYTDDAAVFAALLAIMGRHIKPRHRASARAEVARLRDEA